MFFKFDLQVVINVRTSVYLSIYRYLMRDFRELKENQTVLFHSQLEMAVMTSKVSHCEWTDHLHTQALLFTFQLC